jgi:pyrophosphatase PpaX
MTGLPADAIPEEVRRQAVMIGDTKYDIGCANNADIDSVLVGWSHYVDMEDMEAHGFAPTHIIRKPEELLDII